MRRARVAGLDVIALTDHDALAGHDEAREALPDGLTLVGGMEMSCSLGDRSVHMLAFLTDPADQDLAAELQAITTDRLRRGRAMVDRLRDLAAEVSWEQVTAIAAGGVVGRPHIARAMVAAGLLLRPEAALSSDRPRRVRAAPGAGGQAMSGVFNVRFFWEVFVTLLVITDPPGVVPPFLGLTRGLPSRVRNRLAWQAAVVAFGVIVAFALFGQSILAYLGVGLPALQRAGGLLPVLDALQLQTGSAAA